MHQFSEIIFWLSLVFVLYVYFGYPALLFISTRLKSYPVDKRNFFPTVTMVITAYNEEKNIKDKLNNAVNLNYPKDKFNIIVVSDGSSDGTNDIIQEFANNNPRIKFINIPERGGKPQALNKAVSEADGEIIVFSDVRQIYDENAIIELVSNFNDIKVGAVSGELHLVNPNEKSVGEGIGIYWKYEKFIRKMESFLYSMSGATGAIYAIRRALYKPIPEDTILDDVVIPINVVLKGYRVIFEENAKAYDKVSETTKQEMTRKIRTLSGNYQILFRMPELYNPKKNKVFFQLLSHKFFRLFVPFAMIFAFVSNIILSSISFYRIALILQICLYLSAVIGFFLSKEKSSFISKFFTVPYTFVMLNYSAIAGLYRFITNKQNSKWDKAQ